MDGQLFESVLQAEPLAVLLAIAFIIVTTGFFAVRGWNQNARNQTHIMELLVKSDAKHTDALSAIQTVITSNEQARRDEREADMRQHVADEVSRQQLASAMATMSQTVARTLELPEQITAVLRDHETVAKLEFTKRDSQFDEIGNYMSDLAQHMATLAAQFKQLSTVPDDTAAIYAAVVPMRAELNRLTNLTETHIEEAKKRYEQSNRNSSTAIVPYGTWNDVGIRANAGSGPDSATDGNPGNVAGTGTRDDAESG